MCSPLTVPDLQFLTKINREWTKRADGACTMLPRSFLSQNSLFKDSVLSCLSMLNDARCSMNIISEIEEDIIPSSMNIIFLLSRLSMSPSCPDGFLKFPPPRIFLRFLWWLVICGVMMWCQNVMRMNDCAEWAAETRSGYQVHSAQGSFPFPHPCSSGRWPRPGPRLTRNVPPGRTSEKYHCRFGSKLPKYPESI